MKRPRYYCESCGVEVRKDARVCPRCGRFFSSVKCPRCGHVGMADDFTLGCPICGYADPANAPPEPMGAAPASAPPLPWWAFPAAAALLLALVLLLLRSIS
jgi:rRNA maturation protein Nop10